MSGKVTKQIALLLAAVMAFALLGTGCGSGDKAKTDSAGKAGVGKETKSSGSGGNEPGDISPGQLIKDKEYGELPRVTVKYFYNRNIPQSKSEITKNLEEEFNLDLVIMGVPDDHVETKLNIMLASGSMPDIFPVYWIEEIKKKGCASFTETELQQWMPETYKYINEFAQSIGKEPAKIWQRYYVDEKLNQIPQIWSGGANPYGLLWRKDILDDLGKEIPSTLAGMEDILAAYKAKYPDQFPISAPGKDVDWQTFTYAMCADGYREWGWDIKDGKIINPFLLDTKREILEILAEWQKKGYINPSWPTMDYNTYVQEWANGKMLFIDWAPVEPIEGENIRDGSLAQQLYTVVSGAKTAFGSRPALEEGTRPGMMTWDPFHGGSFAFGRHLEKDRENLYRLMDFQDRVAFDADLNKLIMFGIKGKHWEIDQNGKVLRLSGAKTNEEQIELNLGYWSQYFNVSGRDGLALDTPVGWKEIQDEVYGNGGIYSAEMVRRAPSAKKDAAINDGGEDLDKKYYTNLEKKMLEIYYGIITGQDSITAWDDYKEFWQKNGGPELTELVNEQNMKYWE